MVIVRCNIKRRIAKGRGEADAVPKKETAPGGVRLARPAIPLDRVGGTARPPAETLGAAYQCGERSKDGRMAGAEGCHTPSGLGASLTPLAR